MNGLRIVANCLGFELHDAGRLVALYRATEELDREESPKPCFAPIYTPSGKLVTEYRPKDHPWHTGLFFGWVHVNESNLWGGGWYLPELGRYENVPGTHGRQAHERFDAMRSEGEAAWVTESLSWRDARDAVLATEQRRFEFTRLRDPVGTLWRISSEIRPAERELVLGASRAARYGGLVLRMGAPFADAEHRTSEGVRGHEAVMGMRARWCCAAGACGGTVAIFDHPGNPRHPAPWFARRNLIGPALLMDSDLTLGAREVLHLRYALLVLDTDPADSWLEAQYRSFVGG